MNWKRLIIPVLAFALGFTVGEPLEAAQSASVTEAREQALGWDLWERFAQSALEGGRIVNRSDDALASTSEGQSYGLFFALAAGDRRRFDEMLSWTENNLCGGDCTKRLPAWRWGRSERKDPKTGGTLVSWGVLDGNNASDSDLWIAYSLIEAGRLWDAPELTRKGRALAELALAQSFDIQGLGSVLPPGEKGFSGNGLVRQNPSYYPLFLLKRLEAENPEWRAVRMGAVRVIMRGARSGFAADWTDFDRFGTAHAVKGELGSWDAVRVYLWAGMMSEEDPESALLKRHLAAMQGLTAAANIPPERVFGAELRASGPGPDAFAACLLPWNRNSRTGAFARTVLAQAPLTADYYYQSVLTLFGLGFDRGVFAFDADGRLFSPRMQP